MATTTFRTDRDESRALALRDLLNDFEVKQRGLLLMAIDKAMDKAMKKQSEMLETIRTKVETRHCAAVDELRDDLSRLQPSLLLETLIGRTMDVQQNPGLVNWMRGDDENRATKDKKKKYKQTMTSDQNSDSDHNSDSHSDTDSKDGRSLKDEALVCLTKLRGHLVARQGNAFRSDFEALLVLYMEYLEIPMEHGARLNNRIEDLYQGLLDKAGAKHELMHLVHRVRWACFGVRAIGNARSHEATLLSESEIFELCGCFSALGAGLPTLALEFNVSKKRSDESGVTSLGSSDKNVPRETSNSGKEMEMLAQLREAAAGNGSDQTPFDFIIQLMANNGFNVNNASASPPLPESQTNSPSLLSSGFSNDSFTLSGSTPSSSKPPGLTNLSLSGLNLNSSSMNGSSSALNGLTLNGLNLHGSTLTGSSMNGGSTTSGSTFNGSAFNESTLTSLNLHCFDSGERTSSHVPPLSRLGSIGSLNSNTSQPIPIRYNDKAGGVWSQPPLPPSYATPPRNVTQSPMSLGYDSPPERSPHSLRAESPVKSSLYPLVPYRTESQPKAPPQPPAAVAAPQNEVPSQANLALVSTFTLYHHRPTELPRESDRVRKAMFARMLNHMNSLPKATLCPLLPSHDPTCPLSHTYMEVMTYNPLYKRLVCRQPSHYWGSQVSEDESCVCLHIDTGLTWEWMDEARDKRMYCLRGAKCTNTKCFKSHSFEEMCWYNPSYKIKRCTVRAHDHIARARGTIAPPLDCSYYHIEEGKNADKRDFTAEHDHVGKDVKMLFTERTHKPLADLLEAARYARAYNL
uniref:Uncharacterized protein n=1 Tax=Hyaloperonospora arabidopsidis (strain Emoy2) TaxID=559515 RepID=M4BSH6_HYAAE